VCVVLELLADLSDGAERFPVEVVTEYEVTDAEITSLTSGFTYVTQNKWTPPTNPCELAIPMLDPAATTISEALDSQASARVVAHSAKKSRRVKPATGDEVDTSVESQDNPTETRRLFSRGLSCPLQVRMTAKCGWGLFTQRFIAKGTFLCEYVGELLTAPESERRTLLYISKGTHPVSGQARQINNSTDECADSVPIHLHHPLCV
jgi:hypothetical protein